MDSMHREKFISLLKDSVLTLCKNGLMDDHHGITRVEGLLGITMQNKEVFLVNIREELLPPFASSQSSPGNKTHLKQPLKLATAATDNCGKGSCFSTAGDRQSRTNSVQREATFAEVAVCCDNKENSLGNNPRLRVAGNQYGKDESQSRGELSAMTIDSGDDDDDDDARAVDFSESLTRPRRMKDESDDLVCDVDSSPSDQRKNSDGTLVYQSTTESESLFIWPNDPKGGSLSGIPCGYLPLALGYRGHRGGFDDPSPPSSALPFPGLLPMFYDGAQSIPQAPSFSPCRNGLRTGGSGRQLKKYCCDICSYRSNRSYNLLRHVMHVHAIGSGPCADCGVTFNHRMQLRAHRVAVHGDCDGTGVSADAGNPANAVKTEPEEMANS